MVKNNNKENQEINIITAVALTISVLVAIYLYKKWKEEQRKTSTLEEILKIKDKNNKVSWDYL